MIRESNRRRLEWRGNVALGLGGGLAIADWLPSEVLSASILVCCGVYFFHSKK